MKKMRITFTAVIAVASISFTLSAAALLQEQSPPPKGKAQELPSGLGKEKFVHVCSGCHLTNVVIMQRKTADGWTDIAVEMRNRGANASDEDLEQIVQYLSTNFGPIPSAVSSTSRVNINTADATDIATVLSLSKTQAEAIVVYRSKNRKFKDIAAVKSVPGVERGTIENNKERIDF